MSANNPLPLLEAVDLNRTLGEGEARTHAVRDVCLKLFKGRSYAIVGPSGCGKSTLLYILGLIDRPDRGHLSVEGKPLVGLADAERTRVRRERLGFVFQFHFLLKEFSVIDNILLPMERAGVVPEAQREPRALELLEAVGLAGKARRYASQLSGGEQQRVAVARALANRPAIVFADEPTGNLDRHNGEMVFGLLHDITRAHGQTLLMVTHNPDLAQRCDERIAMEDGRVVAE